MDSGSLGVPNLPTSIARNLKKSGESPLVQVIISSIMEQYKNIS